MERRPRSLTVTERLVLSLFARVCHGAVARLNLCSLLGVQEVEKDREQAMKRKSKYTEEEIAMVSTNPRPV